MFKIFLFIIYSFASVNLFAQDKPPQVQKQMQPIHPLAKSLSDFGATNCIGRANQIATFLSGSSTPDLVVQTPKDNPNNNLLMATMAVPFLKDRYALTSIALAPNQANGCGGSYHSIFYSPKLCAKAFVDNFPTVKFQSINNTNIKIGVVNRGLWIIGMPADKGCILLKEEILE